MRRAWLLAAPAGILVVLFVTPMALVLVNAGDGAAWKWASEPYARNTLAIAMDQAFRSTLLTLAIAIPLAWFYHTRRVPGERLQLALHAAPFVMPVFVVVYGLQAILGTGGWLQGKTGGVDLLAWLGPMGAVVLAHAYYNYGFAARLLHAALERRPHRLEEAARTMGASRSVALWRITLPLLMPTIGAVALLVFLFAFASFGTVLLMGGKEVRTLETVLYGKVNQIFPDYAEAAVLGVLQLVLNGLLLAEYLLLRRRTLRLPREPPRHPRRAGPAAQTVAWIAVALGLAPILAVLVGGFRLSGHWSLDPWRSLLSHPQGFDLANALGMSLFYAVTAGAIALLLCGCLAYGSRGLATWPRRAVEAVASLPLAASSALIGLGFLLAFGPSLIFTLGEARYSFAYTPWIVLAAHVLLVFPFAARVILPAFESHDIHLDDAARMLGAPPRDVARRIHWPLMRKPLLVAAGFCIALSLGDFGASTILSTTDTSGIAVWTNRLDGAFNPILHARATALAGLLGILAAAAYLLVERAGRAAEVTV